MASFNIDAITNAQVAEIEELLSESFTDLFIKGKPSWKLQSALAFMALRTENPNLKFEDVLNGNLTVVVEALEYDNPKDETLEK